MQQLSSLSRKMLLLNFIVNFLSSILIFVGLFLLSPQEDLQGQFVQILANPMLFLIFFATLALLILNAWIFFRSPSLILVGLGLIASAVGALAYLSVFFFIYVNTGGVFFTRFWPPNLLFLLSLVPFCLPLTSFCITGYNLMSLVRKSQPSPASGTPHSTFVATEQSTSLRHERAAPSALALEDRKQQSTWSLSRDRLVALLVGVLLYALLDQFYFLWEVPRSEGDSIIVYPVLLISLLFGMIFGPWVGLATGGIGSLLSTIGQALFHFSPIALGNWSALTTVSLSSIAFDPRTLLLSPGFALIGFIAGLPLLAIPGWERKISSFCALTARGVLAVFSGLLFVSILSPTVSSIDFRSSAEYLVFVLSRLGQETIPTLIFVVLLLPLFLKLFDVWRSHLSLHWVLTFPIY